jgi:hypothetical protein
MANQLCILIRRLIGKGKNSKTYATHVVGAGCLVVYIGHAGCWLVVSCCWLKQKHICDVNGF